MENGGDNNVSLVHLYPLWEGLDLTAWHDDDCNHVTKAMYPMHPYLERPIGESDSYD